tara:strand:+ start:364 stop:498 length:135 start_codon:yes stop_codon:yes gene_type:complete
MKSIKQIISLLKISPWSMKISRYGLKAISNATISIGIEIRVDII